MNPFKAAGRYVKRVLLGIDQLGNTIIGGAPDETISARAGRNAKRRGWRVLVRVLNTIDPGHTDGAIRSERVGSQQADAYRDVYDPEDADVTGFNLTFEEADPDAN
jgi:hypothetical protein